jgi:hypothetical protein
MMNALDQVQTTSFSRKTPSGESPHRIYMVYTCPHRLEGKEGGIQPEQQVLMLQSRDRAPKPVQLNIPNPAHTHRSCFSARDRRRLSRRCCRGRLRILTFHLQILIFLLFEHDGFYPSLLVVYTPTGGTFGLLLGVGSEFELLQTASVMTGET